VDVLEVIAEPQRRRILDVLLLGDRAVGELVGELELSQPNVSKHLRVLREHGLVDVRVAARQRIYALRAARLREVDDWLIPYRLAWSDRLDDLERRLDQMEDD
jgi:DNA-binding transcriptional ArsR family regulator